MRQRWRFWKPMKCKYAFAKLGKLSQHSSIKSYANELQNLYAKIVTKLMCVGDKIHLFFSLM